MRESYLTVPLMVFVLAGVLMVLVLRGKTQSPLHRIFSLMLLAMALWGLTIFGIRASGGPDTAIVWEKAALVAVLGVTLFFYHFTRLFVGQTGERRLLVLLYMASATMAGLVVSGLVVDEMERQWYGYAPRIETAFGAYLAVVFSVTLLGIRNLLKYYRNPPSEAARNRTLYVLLGVGCSLVGGIFDSLPPLMNAYPVGMVGNLLFAFVTAVAILKHNLLDARVVIKKGFVYSVVSGVILGVYIALLLSLNLLFQNNATALSWSGNLLAVLAVAILLKPLLDRVQRLADRWFSRMRHDYLHTLETLSRETKDITNLPQLAMALEQAISLALGAEDVRLLVPSANSSRFAPVTDRNAKGTWTFGLRASSLIVAWLRSHDEVLRREDLETLPEFLALPGKELDKVEHFGLQLLIPLKNREQLAGVLALSGKRSEERYSEEDLELLRAVANQTAMGLENARLFASVVSQRTRLEQLLERVIGAQEDERKRLSLELHDSPVQWLTSAVYRLEASLGFLRKGEYQRAREELEEVQEGLDTTLAELRHTTAALHPPELEKVGLVKALARYVGVFERDTAIPCRVEENGPVPRLPAPVELAVFRVVQEALSNIRKHSKATEAQVDIGLHKESFRAVVRDNGIGFEVDDSQRIDNGHLGLAGMRERARILGGTLDIHSALGAGTQVILQVLLSQTPSTLDQQVEVAMEPKTKPRRLEVAV